jgi:hypothetical protein
VFNATDVAVKQDLDPHISAHIVRIKPKTWIGNCALRVEFLGWYEGKINFTLKHCDSHCQWRKLCKMLGGGSAEGTIFLGGNGGLLHQKMFKMK